ncbi:MAG: Hsp20/alpha crystallin family protein [Sedimentisphaerales bacterium]|nr:Hsp20/alpha crystallin family protein [Sedimentisphaerales bacterium]
MANINIKKEPSQNIEKSEAQSPAAMERTRERTVFVPRTDIYENADALVLISDIPGVDENSVEINVDRRVLTIAGRVAPEQLTDHRLSYTEYENGDFERSFTLADEVDVDKIEAAVKNGVLRLVLPKSEAAKPKKITVKAG